MATTMQINSYCMESAGDSVENQDKCHCKITSVNNELKLLLAQMNIITKWIENKFGTSIINTNSELFSSSAYKREEIESLSESLRLPYDFGIPETTPQLLENKKARTRKGNRKKTAKEGIDHQNFSGCEAQPVTCTPAIATGKSRKCASKTAKSNACAIYAVKTEKNGSITLKKTNVNTSEAAAFALDEELDLINKETNSPRKKKGKPKDKKVTKSDQGKAGQIKSKETSSARVRAKNSDWRRYACSGPKQCDECGKVVMGTSSLKQHKRMHADERPFECVECKQTFRYRKNLKIHMIALHNGERHLQCSFCGKKFYAPKDLKIHERTHTGHKPYACHICPKKFNIKEHLTMHIRVHTGERPYKCPICDKSFSQANSLRIHKKIHTISDEKSLKKRKSEKPKGVPVTNSKIAPNCSAADNDLVSQMLPTSVSAFQLMVPTMQTVTAAIVSVSTVTSPFPCVNLSQPQSGNENPLAQANYIPVMGSQSEQIKSSLAIQSSVSGDSSKILTSPDAEEINRPKLSISEASLGNLFPENVYDMVNSKNDSSYIYENNLN